MKKSAFFLFAFMLWATHSWALSYTFSGESENGIGSAVMEILVSGNTLNLWLDNTSPLNLKDGSGFNAPGITGFGYLLANDDDVSLTSWVLSAYNSNGILVEIAKPGMTSVWDMTFNKKTKGVQLDYMAGIQDVKGALYNPSQRQGLAALPNYFTKAALTMVFDKVPVLETMNQDLGSDISGLTYVRMQNVGANGQGSLKLVGEPAPIPEPGTLLLLGSGLIGLAVYRQRKSRV